MDSRRLTGALVALSLAIAILSIAPSGILAPETSWMQEWMWFIVSVSGLFIVAYPNNKPDGFYFRRPILVMALIPVALQAVLASYAVAEGLDWNMRNVSVALMAWAAVSYGYMLAISIDSFTEIKLSNRWMLVFSLLFCMAIVSLQMLSQFVFMVSEGYPIFDGDLFLSVEKRLEVNAVFGTGATVAVVISILASAVLRKITCGKDQALRGGAEDE